MTSPTSQTKPAPERKKLETFALHVVFLTLLFWLLPSLDAAYGYGFTSVGNATLGRLGPSLRVDYRWVPPREREAEGEIEMVGFMAGYARPVWESRYSIRDRGYEPTAALIALVLATPATRRRHIVGSIVGAAGLGTFFLGQKGLLSACLFAAFRADVIPLGGMLASVLPVIEAFFGSPLVRYAAVFAVWALVAAPARGLDLDKAGRPLAALLRRGRAD